MDDGKDGSFSLVGQLEAPISGSLVLEWNTSEFLPETTPLVSGRIYKFKYSSTNAHGESELSDEVSILVANRPEPPTNLQRIDLDTVIAGSVRVLWQQPADEGEDPTLGYKLYLDNNLFADFSTLSSLNNYTFTGLQVSRSYVFSVTALNDIGESDKQSITEIASAPPSQLRQAEFVSSSLTTLTVEAPEPSFNGGSPVTVYAFQRNDGPLSEW
jgi:hypothetical protein